MHKALLQSPSSVIFCLSHYPRTFFKTKSLERTLALNTRPSSCKLCLEGIGTWLGIFQLNGCANAMLNLGLTGKSSLPMFINPCCKSQWLHVVCLFLGALVDEWFRGYLQTKNSLKSHFLKGGKKKKKNKAPCSVFLSTYRSHFISYYIKVCYQMLFIWHERERKRMFPLYYVVNPSPEVRL